MQQAPFKFTLVFKGTRVAVTPQGVGKAKLKAEKDDNFIFLRQKFSGELTFTGADFKYLHAIEKSADRCEEIGLEIDSFCGGAYKPWKKFYFSLNNVKWNVSKGQAKVTPVPNDAYRALLENYGKQHNVLEVPATHTVKTKVELDSTFEFTLTGLNEQPATDTDTWKTFLEATYWVDGDLTEKGYRFDRKLWFRMVRTAGFIGGFARDLSSQGWQLIEEDPAAQQAKYAKQPDLYNFKPYIFRFKSDFTKYPDLKVVSCGTAIDTTKYIVATQGAAFVNDCWNLRKDTDNDNWIKLQWEFGTFTYTRNRKLLAVVRHLADKTAYGLNLLPATDEELSQFFTSPVNYVTEAENQVKDLLIAHKSDLIAYNSSEAATKGMLSLKELTEALRSSMQVFWYIDAATGKFKLEHISYIKALTTIDLTTPELAEHAIDSNAYEYETTKMPRYEKLQYTEALADDFLEGVIEYGGVCVTTEEGQDTQETTINKFNNDLEQIITTGESLNRDGFALICHKNGQVLKEAGDLTGTMLLNGHLAAANLLKHYHQYNRVLATGLQNGKVVTFKSVKKTKKQIALTLPACCTEFSPYAFYKTLVSEEGELKNIETNLATGMAKLDIVHEVTGSGTIDLTRQFSEQFNLSFR